MTKIEQRKAILTEIDRLWHQANDSITRMQASEPHPILRDLISRKQAQKVTLEDINQFINNLR